MENKFCKNCKYYLQHYIKNVNGKLLTVDFGHCYNGKKNLRTRKKHVKSDTVCEYRRPIKEQIQERRNNIIEELKLMRKRISEIAEILKTEL